MIVIKVIAGTLIGITVANFVLVLCILAKTLLRIAWLKVKLAFSSRGEEAGTPERACTCEDCDDLMAIADAVAADLDAEDWQLWERQMARAEQ